MMTNQTDSQAIVKGGRLGIVPRGGGGKLHVVLPIGSITGAASNPKLFVESLAA